MARYRSVIGWVTLTCLVIMSSGCQAARNLPARATEDLFVVVSSPVQVPVMAASSAYDEERPAISIAAFPFTYVYQVMKHTTYASVHAIDLALAPVHLLHDSDSLGIYDKLEFPMKPGTRAEKADQYFGAFTIALAGAAILVGVVALSLRGITFSIY